MPYAEKSIWTTSTSAATVGTLSMVPLGVRIHLTVVAQGVRIAKSVRMGNAYSKNALTLAR